MSDSLKRTAEEAEVLEAENGTKKVKTGDDEVKDDKAGVLLVGGGVNWDMIGRKAAPKGTKPPPKNINVNNLWGPHVWRGDVRVKTIASSCTACHSALIAEDGKVYTWGRNDSGQLGVGDTDVRFVPTLVEALEDYNIVAVATGRSHTLFLTDKGEVLSCGSDKSGQLGQGKDGKNQLVPKKIDYVGKPIDRMACGAEFSMIITTEGALYSFGSPEYGQLGHGTDGKFLEKAQKVSFHFERSPRLITKFIEKNKQAVTPIHNVRITDVQCGVNHAVALDDKGRVFTWGFGGYGRLGHAETKDEMVPRQVKQLESFRCTVTKIAAGSTFCLAAATNKNLYYWGQTKPTGEAAMYPKLAQDLCGWNIHALACANKSIVVLADDAVVTWGPSPTYGELMYGEGREKSSTNAKEVKPLEGVTIKEVACGFAHTLLIAKDTTEKDRELLAKLPKWP